MKIALIALAAVLASPNAYSQLGLSGQPQNGIQSASESATSSLSGAGKAAESGAQPQPPAYLKQVQADQANMLQAIKGFGSLPPAKQAEAAAALRGAAAQLDQLLAKAANDPQTKTQGEAAIAGLRSAAAQQQQIDASVSQLSAAPSTPATLVQNALQAAQSAQKGASNPVVSNEISGPIQQAMAAMTAAMQNAAALRNAGGSSAAAPSLTTTQQIQAALAQIQKSQQSLAQQLQSYPQLAPSQRKSSLDLMTSEAATNDKIFQAFNQQAVQQALSRLSAQDQQGFIASAQAALKQEQSLETNLNKLQGTAPAGDISNQKISEQQTLALTPADSAALAKQKQAAADAAAAQLKQQQAAAALAAKEHLQQVHEEQLSRGVAALKPAPTPAPKPVEPTKPSPVVAAASSAQQAAALQKLQDSLAKIKDQQDEAAERETELRGKNPMVATTSLLAMLKVQLAQIDAQLLPLEKTGPATIAASPAPGQAALKKSLQAAIDLQSRLKDGLQPQHGNIR